MKEVTFHFSQKTLQKVIDFKCNYVLVVAEKREVYFLFSESNYNDKVGNLITRANLCSTQKMN